MLFLKRRGGNICFYKYPAMYKRGLRLYLCTFTVISTHYMGNEFLLGISITFHNRTLFYLLLTTHLLDVVPPGT